MPKWELNAATLFPGHYLWKLAALWLYFSTMGISGYVLAIFICVNGSDIQYRLDLRGNTTPQYVSQFNIHVAKKGHECL